MALSRISHHTKNTDWCWVREDVTALLVLTLDVCLREIFHEETNLEATALTLSRQSRNLGKT